MGMRLYTMLSILVLMAVSFLQIQLPLVMAGCPLDMTGFNISMVASICSDHLARGKCCRYINALVALSNARHANATADLGVDPALSEVCLHFISETLKLYGLPPNATNFCGFGTKIPVNYDCKGRTTVTQMLQSPGFTHVAQDCNVFLLDEIDCKRCINSSISYLHHSIEVEDNVTLNTCRDATFVALASQADNASATELASCFFGVPGFRTRVSRLPSSSVPPKGSPSALAASPSELSLGVPMNESHHHYRLAIIPGVAITVSVVSFVLLVVIIFLIHRKSRELQESENGVKPSTRTPSPRSVRKVPDAGPGPTFRKFSYKETKKATDNFSTVIGQGGFGTVYKAQFRDGLSAAVKRMDKVSEQAEDEFCREIELLARLHHRHLVALKGFCIEKQERFLVYEYMEKGSLKDHLHSPDRVPLSWRLRIQIAIDVANALEYLHFYCDPALCHRDIKSSNILLDENFIAKVADFGLAHALKEGSIFFEPINTDVRGTPGYMDPEYVVTRELTEKSDVYSYGVVLLELVTGRRAIQDNKNLIEWSQVHMDSELRLPELVDPSLGDSYDCNQLQTMITIVKWCTQKEGQTRPSIKQVLRLLYESSDPLHSRFLQAVEDEDYEETQGPRRTSKGKMHRNEVFQSGDGRYLASSSSTSRSCGSRNFLLENGSPQSPSNLPSV